MSRQQSLQRGSALMVLGALIFLAYAVVFFFRAFSSSGFEIGVATLNGVTTQQLNGINPAITGYIRRSSGSIHFRRMRQLPQKCRLSNLMPSRFRQFLALSKRSAMSASGPIASV
jgi:hypothetical protein